MQKHFFKNNTDLFVTGEIGFDFSAEFFMRELSMLANNDIVPNVHLFSAGGNVFDALAVFDFVKLKGIKFNAFVSGLCGSACTIIAASSQKTEIGANSFWFVHRAFNDGGQKTNEVQRTVDSINERIVNIYKDLTGLSKPKIKTLLDAGDKGEFLNATQAVDLGFVSGKFKEAQLAANIDFHKAHFINGSSLANALNIEANNKINIKLNNMDITKQFETFKSDIMAFFKEHLTNGKEEITEDTITNKVSEILSAKSTEIEAHITTITTDLDSEKEQNKTHVAKIVALEREVNEIKMKGTNPKGSGDPDPKPNDPPKLTEGQKVLQDIYKNASPLELANAGVKIKTD